MVKFLENSGSAEKSPPTSPLAGWNNERSPLEKGERGNSGKTSTLP
jgi:hypothetical protein